MAMTPTRILLADYQAESRSVLSGVLEKEGYLVDVAGDGASARRALESSRVDLMIADLVVPGMDGFELLRAAQEVHPTAPVILMSEYGTIETAVEALKMGAYHYFQKPLDVDAVRKTVSEALDNHRSPPGGGLPQTGAALASPAPENLGIVGQGRWFEEVMALLRKLAPSRATVLLTGESGTGKEVFARAIHRMSNREGPFVAVSCGALPRDLLESELFGHEKGAFTGADYLRAGRFELADGGTLLLDEVGDIPVDLQVKLLRVLQERQFERVGGTSPVDVDVRIVAATNRDPAAAVREGSFREDLYYRLKVVEISLPSLRERPEDIVPLTRRFIQTYARANGRSTKRPGEAVLELVRRYPWPGNVRELENAIERAVVLSEPDATELDPALLPDSVRNGTPTLYPNGGWLTLEPDTLGRRPGPPQQMEEQEWIRAVSEALQKTSGNAARAARLLGVSSAIVRRAADNYGLPRRGNGRRSR
jgi:DNA-binding NtrC family response regulator